MTLIPRIVKNVVWNWAGFAAETIAGFLIAPFLIHELGDTVYGIWIIIASLTGYFNFLDLGVRGSVGRQIAFCRAQKNQEGINKSLSTAMAILGAAAVLGLIATFGLQLFFLDIFHVPIEVASPTRAALILVGVNFSFMLLMNVFDATLWGFQRFDVLNLIDIPIAVFRVILTYVLIGHGYGILALAIITFSSSIACALLKGLASYWICTGLRFRLSYITLASARSLFSYSIWLFALSISQMIVRRLSPLIVGAQLSVGLVTPYSIVTRLIGYAISLFDVSTGVLTPFSAGLCAENNEREQHALHIKGGLYCSLVALCLCTLLLCLGPPFIVLWMGPTLSIPYDLLVVLSLGEVVPLSQHVSKSVVLGMARHRPLALVSCVEACTAIGLGVLLGKYYGLFGVACAFAGSGSLCRGVFLLVYSCRLVNVTVSQYVWRAFIPPLVIGACPITALVVLTRWRSPSTWFELVLYVGGFCSIYFVCSYVFLMKWRVVNVIRPLSMHKATERDAGRAGAAHSVDGYLDAVRAQAKARRRQGPKTRV